MAEHHRCIEAGAAGDGPGAEGGFVAALCESEARSEVAADGGAEGVCIGNWNGVAVGIVDREGAVASGIDGEIDLNEGIGIGIAAAAGK